MNQALERAKMLIEEKMALGAPVIVALEGGAATGKSTLAAQLSRHFSAPVISMDEFFLLPDLRTEERFCEAGGNIHYERFEEEVAAPIRAGEAFSRRCEDLQAFDDIRAVGSGKTVSHEIDDGLGDGFFAFAGQIEKVGVLSAENGEHAVVDQMGV